MRAGQPSPGRLSPRKMSHSPRVRSSRSPESLGRLLAVAGRRHRPELVRRAETGQTELPHVAAVGDDEREHGECPTVRPSREEESGSCARSCVLEPETAPLGRGERVAGGPGEVGPLGVGRPCVLEVLELHGGANVTRPPAQRSCVHARNGEAFRRHATARARASTGDVARRGRRRLAASRRRRALRSAPRSLERRATART